MSFRCDICHREFMKRNALGAHTKFKHTKKTDAATVKCPECGRECKGTLGLNRRMRLKHDPKTNAVISENSRRMWADKETHDRIVSGIRKAYESDDVRRKVSEATSIALSNPETRAKLSEASKRMWERPEYREKMRPYMDRIQHDPEMRERHSEAMSAHWADSEYRSRVSAHISESHRRRIAESTDEELQKWLGPHHGAHSDILNKSGKKVHCQSSFELRYCELLLRDESVKDFDRSGLWLDIIGTGRKYNPDFMVVFSDGHRELVEVKSSLSIRDPLVPFKAEAAISWCEENSAVYRLLKEDQLDMYESLLNGDGHGIID